MPKEYNLDEQLNLPDKLIEKKIGSYYLEIAPEYPNWLVLSDAEQKMFEILKTNTIRKTLEQYYLSFLQDENKCLSIMTELLSQITDVNFFNNSDIKKEDPVETIKKKVHIGTTNGCNMHCMHCYMAAGTMPLKTINVDKTIQLVHDLQKVYGSLEIVISGGEPFTFKNLQKLLIAIKDNYIILFTNGSLINEGNIDLLAECCDEVQISFEGVSKAVYESIRGIGNYDKVIHAIDLLKSKNIRIVLAITILPNTFEDIKNNLIDFVKMINYQNLEIRLSDEIEMSGNALSMDMSSYDKYNSKKTIIELIHQLFRMGCVSKKNDNRNVRFTNCGIGTNVVINYDGFIYPCHKLSDLHLNADDNVETIIQKFNELNINTSNSRIVKCKACDLRYICSGGCRIDNYKKSGNMLSVICDDKYKEQQYERLVYEYLLYK